MKQIQIDEFGTPEVFSYTEQEALIPSPHQIIVQVAYASLNPVDYKTRKGLGFVAEKVKSRLPWTPGYDVSGIIISKGDLVSGWEIGQRVCGLVNFPLPAGGYSEQVAVLPEMLSAIPEGVPDDIAAALPLAGLTAWQGLKEVGHLCSGQNILILAAAGGVGHIAVQLSMKTGAQVWGAASLANQTFLEGLGARYVNYHDGGQMSALPEMDMVFDAVGGETGEAALRYLREGGVLVTLPTITADNIVRAAQRQGKTAIGFTVHPDVKQLQQLLQYAANAQLGITISKVYGFDDIVEAHNHSESGHVRGKIVMSVKGHGAI